MVKDASGRFVWVSDNLARRYGFADPAEMVGLDDYAINPPQLIKMYRRDDLEVMRSGRPLLGRIELCFNEGGMLDWNVTNKLPLCDAGGKVIGLIATIQEYPGMQRLPVFGGELRPVIEYIFAHLGQSLHVAQLAEIAGVSCRQIERRFRNATGMSPTDFIIRRGSTKPAGVYAKERIDPPDRARPGFLRSERLYAVVSPVSGHDAQSVSPNSLPQNGRSSQHTRNAAGPAAVRKKSASGACCGNSARYWSAQAARNSSARAVSTSAQTLPPKPAPNAEAATAPSRRAEAARKIGLRHLVAQQPLGGLLRTIDQPAERPQIAAGQGIVHLGNDLAAFDHEVLKPGGQRGAIEGAGVGRLHERFQSLGGVRRTAQGGRQMRFVAAGLAPPQLGQRRGQPRGRVEFFPRRAGLLGHHAAGADGEDVARRNRQQLLELHRAIGVLADVVRLAQRMAVWSSLPPKVPTPRSPSSVSKTLPVLDRAQVTRQVGLAADVVPVLVAGGQLVGFRQDRGRCPPSGRWNCSCRRRAAGRSASATSAPRHAPGKFRATRRATVIG